MDELVKLVAQKAGITEQQARTALDTAMGYMKERMPEPLVKQMEAMMGGGQGNPLDALGGMLGRR